MRAGDAADYICSGIAPRKEKGKEKVEGNQRAADSKEQVSRDTAIIVVFGDTGVPSAGALEGDQKVKEKGNPIRKALEFSWKTSRSRCLH